MLKLRSAWLALGWLWVAAVFYLSLTPHPPEPMSFEGADKLDHALAYCFLMLWFSQLRELSRLRTGAALVAMGCGIEVLQGMTGYRMFEYADMLANTTGVLLGWGAAHTKMSGILEILEKHGRS